MSKTGMIIFASIFLFLSYHTIISAEKVFRSEWQMPQIINTPNELENRLVLITQDIDTPFWDKVAKGAIEQAREEGVSLEVWGSYSNNQDEFLRKIDIALYSKVAGIIVQGLDTDEFKNLTKIKASSYGVPIITVANDVPMVESLRRTYVGSDQYEAGQAIAQQLISDMGEEGTVILMYDNQQEFYQEQRLKGIQDVLVKYPDIKIGYAETLDNKDQIVAATQDMLNRMPNAEAIIAVNANFAGTLIQEIGKRSQLEPYYIYTFDDGPESLSLLKDGKVDAMVEQSPERMGKISVQRMVEWLDGETVPLDIDGYFTDIKVIRANDVQ
ncbi:ribose transport system substrate-binding protein [Bacillus oleivorans]|uniref:Ribose transport system substrate-binding protein n=1 Tax=Bacillus oleivorans TaxID=1448271 RepID=A0A285D8G2_9BACI|nr:substrate-binding domain-containing protein [Bacillus oleivorans]SNX75568.1 ribose transport system substrate-binding protein [Bacillus oleivorans]